MTDIPSISLSSISLHTSQLNKRCTQCFVMLVCIIKKALYLIGFGTQISVKQATDRRLRRQWKNSQIVYQSLLVNLYFLCFLVISFLDGSICRVSSRFNLMLKSCCRGHNNTPSGTGADVSCNQCNHFVQSYY